MGTMCSGMAVLKVAIRAVSEAVLSAAPPLVCCGENSAAAMAAGDAVAAAAAVPTLAEAPREVSEPSQLLLPLRENGGGICDDVG